ncbi:Uncharacterised protein [[Clostridium] sordellii]|uniref:Membrane protein n=1 Tax=Paraclostridium sordellii TaxID=1505 RepID=A0ABP1XTF0_PARSO|nr:hypothetical protein [Paeniclostridium sordellii]EPZ57324.1 hypothetical protein H477_2402 [[Clostridium] sordellii ATCC 9714] [Paeniclostridium sordellii ATCC 9714]CEJ73543.1 putative membrane protein [[Clostridium] sordellii] [Paeniclostridium sordellii]CEN69093.1 Uncharacterised protein [[Clostridium] sordellii] [Paeniclostridium sordellii]CEN72361.1 Uncharacterised protein [[Clostridium] sordellii] [Paeniclostridium sordellii]CEO23724.1 Uncharacterised protein [[Clostridium] sordellii] 
MSTYKDWKMIDWIVLDFVGISFIVVPDFILDHNLYELLTMATVYDYPYNIPIIGSGIFLIYCLLSGIYWIKNKSGNSLLIISNHIYNTSYSICYCI